MPDLSLRTVEMTRYVIPLREGGSLPALVEADDGFMYVVKFRGAGQGLKALIAELVVGELARQLGLRMPELVFINLSEAFGRTEPDEEIQDLLRFSTGLNLALHFLSGASTFDPLLLDLEPRLASLIVWLDCLTLNVDRTARNTNLLMWHRELWLIDHGAALYVHHAGAGLGGPQAPPVSAAERPRTAAPGHRAGRGRRPGPRPPDARRYRGRGGPGARRLAPGARPDARRAAGPVRAVPCGPPGRFRYLRCRSRNRPPCTCLSTPCCAWCPA